MNFVRPSMFGQFSLGQPGARTSETQRHHPRKCRQLRLSRRPSFVFKVESSFGRPGRRSRDVSVRTLFTIGSSPDNTQGRRNSSGGRPRNTRDGRAGSGGRGTTERWPENSRRPRRSSRGWSADWNGMVRRVLDGEKWRKRRKIRMRKDMRNQEGLGEGKM